MDINLHIERLVLDGVDIAPGQGDLLHATVINQLTQLLNRGGIAPNIVGGSSLNNVATNSIQLNDGQPQVLGLQIAKSVYGGIGRE
jgi:hypothetical protein